MNRSTRIATLLAFPCVAGVTLAAVPESVNDYLRQCEEKRIKRIFDRRERMGVLQDKFGRMEQPQTPEETRIREELTREIDSLKSELTLLEDFTKQVHPLLDIATVPRDQSTSSGDLYFRNYYGARRFIVVKIVDAKHLVAESFLDLKDKPPQKHSPLITIAMPTAKYKVGDSIEPLGAWNIRALRDPQKRQPDMILATPLDLRPYERHAASVRKASLAEFLKREQAWLTEQKRLQQALDADADADKD